jgi:hypothetical protein
MIIPLSTCVIILIIVMAYALGRDTAVLTDMIVSPLTELAKDMDRVSRFDLSTRRRTGSKGSGKLAKAAAGARKSLRRSNMGGILKVNVGLEAEEEDDPHSSIAEVSTPTYVFQEI